MIRKAVPADISEIVELGLEALAKNGYKDLVVSREKIVALARECVTSPRNFAWVAERDGVIGGALCGLVNDCLVYERAQVNIVQFYTRIPGDGIALMREAVRWWRSRPALKVIVFTLDADADPRIGKLLARLGLKRELPVYMATR